MLWVGGALMVGGAVLAVRAAWVARRTRSTGAHGVLIALGSSLVVWGAVLGGVGLALQG